jgi:hypothetical protein
VTQLATSNRSGIGLSQLAVDSTNVYWVDGSSVLMVGVDGGAVVTLVSGTPGVGPVAVDSTNVYWTTASAVMKAPLAGGPSTTLTASQNSQGYSMTVDGTNVYWGAFAPGGVPSIMEVPISGGTSVTLAANTHLGGPMTLAGGTLVYSVDQSLWSVGLTGGTPTTIASIVGSGGVASLAFNGTDIFIATENGTSGGTIEWVPPSGGTPVAIATNESWPSAVAADTTGVYWTTLYQGGSYTTPGTIRRAALDGSAACTLAVVSADALAVDATSIYWTTGNKIMKATPK